jgi:subtilisin family serine protease
MPKSKDKRSTRAGKRPGAASKTAKNDAAFQFEPVAGTRVRSLTVTAGANPPVQTVIYVHGIGNKPPGSVLKCQWDTALFNGALGDRSRMAYWVNRDFYPLPSQETCASGDLVRIDDDEVSTAAVRAMTAREPVDPEASVETEIEALADNGAERARLRSIAAKLMTRGTASGGGVAAADVQAKLLPVPAFLRRLVTEKITRAFLRDVHEFLFVPQRRETMEQSLLDRIQPGGGPFVVIAHSQGSMIAYNVLRRLTRDQADVRLFLTIGSPLGLQEVQDVLQQFGPLGVPACVSRWVNVADPLDPVAADRRLAAEYTARGGVEVEDFTILNTDTPRHPHSGTGYLKTRVAREVVREAVGPAFSQPAGQAVIIKDLADTIENGHAAERHEVLIQLVTPTAAGGSDLAQSREGVVAAIRTMVKEGGHAEDDAEIDTTRRFVAAKLTRNELERLRTRYRDYEISRIWKNAGKRGLICDSANTIQVRPANTGYSAMGNRITWAVLDTGIAASHPHFQEFGNVKAQWDCTKRGDPRSVAPDTPEFGRLDGNGHGTHVAGIIAGALSVPVKAGKPVRLFAGMAPEATLYGFKVLNDDGTGSDASIIKGLDLIADLNERAGTLVVHGVNLSLGGSFDPSAYNCGHTPLCQELRRLWQQGVLVCLAAGNEGYAVLQAATGGDVPANMDLSIGDPANLEEAIAVGSVHKTNPHTYGISFFSSRGPTADGRRKPDLVAPGEQILSAYYAAQPPASRGTWTAEHLYVEMSGTSMATPHISGVLAAFLSLRREFIGYPDRVKRILLDHCTDLARDPHIQGCGMPNLIKMLVNT